MISFDDRAVENLYRFEPVDELTPERVFERSWAATLLDRAAERLRDEYFAAGKAEEYEQLAQFRLDAAGSRAYTELAARLGLRKAQSNPRFGGCGSGITALSRRKSRTRSRTRRMWTRRSVAFCGCRGRTL